MSKLQVADVSAAASTPPAGTLLVSQVSVSSAGSNRLLVAHLEALSDAPDAGDGPILQIATISALVAGAPTVNAGLAQKVRAYEEVTLHGEVTGLWDEVLWVQQQGTPVALSSMVPTASFTAPAHAEGETLIFELNAEGPGGSSSAVTTVTVVAHTEWYLSTDGTWHPYRNGRI